MKTFLFSAAVALLAISCGDKATTTTKAFCDTACNNDTLVFKGEHKLKPTVTISKKNCLADTLSWWHDALSVKRQMQVSQLLDNTVRLNKDAISCYIKDTSIAYVSFNDCVTGRGYFLQLPFNKKQSISKSSGAINAFDKKFAVAEDLRAYADYTTIYVVNVKTGKKEFMTFKERYDINFNQIHDVIDSVNVSNNRIFVLLKKNGQDVPLEKQITL